MKNSSVLTSLFIILVMSINKANTPVLIYSSVSEFDYRARTLDRADGSIDQSSSSAHSFSNRDAHVKLLMNKRESEFLTINWTRLFVGTWNVNGKGVTEDLLYWFKNAKEEPPSLIALGFQELDLSKEALVFSDSARETEWKRECEAAVNRINPLVKYKTVQVVRLVGVMLILFATEELLPHISDVVTNVVPTGIMGVLRKPMGNKGGVAMRFTVFNSNVCLVTSHLAAHMEQVERRNQDFRDINDKMFYTTAHTDINANNVSIAKNDLVFWFGDLNYRITDLPIDKVKVMIRHRAYDSLIKHDQLVKEKEAKKVFNHYHESEIKFDPTYKYDVGTDEYDTSDKMRVPAWTDRVLYKGKNIKPLNYECHQELRLSDHKPVSQIFDIGVKVINREFFKHVYEDVNKQLDRLENECLPQVKLSVTELDYGDIKFMELKTLTLEVTNTGQVPADFIFIPKLNEKTFCKSWMTVRPYKDSILPNETATIDLSIYVDEKTTSLLNTGRDSIEDILVLHLEGGKDFFVSVLGKYIISSFGCSLHTLIQMPKPIREIPIHDIISLEREVTLDSYKEKEENYPLEIPKELWFLCDNIINKKGNGKKEEDLFQQRGLHHEIIAIIETLDTALLDTLPGNIHSCAETLLIFLDSLKEPVINLYDEALEAASDRLASIDVVSRLPRVNKRVFEYLIEFMVELLQYSNKNRLDINTLGNIFGPVLIRTNSKLEHTKAENELLALRKALFIKNFLLEPDTQTRY